MLKTNDNILTLPTIDIRDERHFLFLDISRIIATLRLRRNFHQIYISGLSEAQALCIQHGAIIAPNHPSVWDTTLFLVVSELLGKRAFGFMEETRLSSLAFLRWCGLLPLDSEDATRAVTQLRAADNLCDEPTQLWLSPQRKLRSVQLTSLESLHTVPKLAAATDYPIIPVAILYRYDEHERPVIYIHFSAALSSSATTSDIEEQIVQGLRYLEREPVNHAGDTFHRMFKRKPNSPSLFTTWLSFFARWRLGDTREQ